MSESHISAVIDLFRVRRDKERTEPEQKRKKGSGLSFIVKSNIQH